MLFPDFFAPSREVHLGSTQAGDGRVLEDFGDFLGDVGDQPQLAGSITERRMVEIRCRGLKASVTGSPPMRSD